MKKMLVGSLDLSKIDKSKIISKDKNGNPFENGAKYYNVVVWINEEVDTSGNIATIQTSTTKEERDNGVKGVYIGNLKNITGQNLKENSKSTGVKDTDDLPF